MRREQPEQGATLDEMVAGRVNAPPAKKAVIIAFFLTTGR